MALLAAALLAAALLAAAPPLCREKRWWFVNQLSECRIAACIATMPSVPNTNVIATQARVRRDQPAEKEREEDLRCEERDGLRLPPLPPSADDRLFFFSRCGAVRGEERCGEEASAIIIML